jgi:hypothetical protein
VSDETKGPGKTKGLKEEVDALRDEANELLGGLRQIFSASRDEIVRSAALGRLRVDIYQHKKERSALLLSLGDQVYAQVQSGALKLPGLTDLLASLEATDASIVATQTQIDDGQIAAAQSAADEAPPPADETPPKKARKPKRVAVKGKAKKVAVKGKATGKKKSADTKTPSGSRVKAKKTPPKKGTGKTPKGS